jgi:hypothetical protein
VNIVDFTNNTSAGGYIGIYNVGAENGIYRNLGIHAGRPIVLASTNVASISSPFQTLQTGCPNSMTGVHMDSVITDSFTAVSPNIEASGTFSNWLTNHQFIGGNAGILFEGPASASNWDVTGEQENTIATSYFIRSTVGVDDSRFHVEALPATAMINPEANNLTYANNAFDFNSDNSVVPLITNTATGTTIKGGHAVVSGTTSASNTTFIGTDIFAPNVTDANITPNAASIYNYKGTTGLISHGANFTQPNTGNTVTLLNSQDAAAALTGDSTDKTFYTFTLPASTLAAGKGIRVSAFWIHGTGTASVTYKLFFGATAVVNTSSAVTGNGSLETVIMNKPGVTNAQRASGKFTPTGTASVIFSGISPAETTANAVVVKATFNVANTDQVTPAQFLVELVQ